MYDNPHTFAQTAEDRDSAKLPDFSDVIMPGRFQVASREAGDRSLITANSLRENLSHHSSMRNVVPDLKDRVLNIVSSFAAGDHSVLNFQELTSGRSYQYKLSPLGEAVAGVLNNFGYRMRALPGEHTIDGIQITHPNGRVYKEIRRNSVAPTYFNDRRQPQDSNFLNDTTFTEQLRNNILGRTVRLQQKRA